MMRCWVLLLLLYGRSVRSLSSGTIRAARGSRALLPQASAAGQPQELTMEDVRAMFRDVRAHYRSTGEVDEAQACRNLMSTRVKDLRVACCAVRPSPLHGDGLFAVRDAAEGELLSFFPADALLVWEGGDRKRNDCMIFFGAHVPQEVCTASPGQPRRPHSVTCLDTCVPLWASRIGSHARLQERDAARILDERVRDYELSVSPVFSAVGDPERREDPAYLGHLANDGATCAPPPPAMAVAYCGCSLLRLYLLWL